MHEASYYKIQDGMALCQLCPNRCIIKDGETGICKTRKFIDGKLWAMNYGHVDAIQIDPIEKKPIYEWHTGTEILSIGSYGCNLHCPYCQNHELVAGAGKGIAMTPEAIVAQAQSRDLDAIAYTYNEPTVYYEMVYETAKLARKKGLYNVLVTNGYINEAPLKALLPYIDAMNIDLKSYSNQRFHDICGGNLKTVLSTIHTSAHWCHVEVTLLMVPELYDGVEYKAEWFKELSERIGDLPLHLTRYFPRYKHETPATDIDWMLRIQKLAKHYFSQVYLGNVY